MLAQDYLTLRLARLKGSEEWRHQIEGITFVFPKGGVGKLISGAVVQRLATGDVLVLNGTLKGRLCVPDRGEMVFWNFTLSLDHRSQLLRVVAAILSAEFKTAHSQRVGFIRGEEHMSQVFERLSANELLNLTVGELAAKFGCSRRHLNRLFHQHFGFSVAALRMEMRLLKAVALLRDPDAKVILQTTAMQLSMQRGFKAYDLDVLSANCDAEPDGVDQFKLGSGSAVVASPTRLEWDRHPLICRTAHFIQAQPLAQKAIKAIRRRLLDRDSVPAAKPGSAVLHVPSQVKKLGDERNYLRRRLHGGFLTRTEVFHFRNTGFAWRMDDMFVVGTR